jgi:hypothetical protein
MTDQMPHPTGAGEGLALHEVRALGFLAGIEEEGCSRH